MLLLMASSILSMYNFDETADCGIIGAADALMNHQGKKNNFMSLMDPSDKNILNRFLKDLKNSKIESKDIEKISKANIQSKRDRVLNSFSKFYTEAKEKKVSHCINSGVSMAPVFLESSNPFFNKQVESDVL